MKNRRCDKWWIVKWCAKMIRWVFDVSKWHFLWESWWEWNNLDGGMSRGLETKMVAFTFTSHLVTMKARQHQMCLPHFLRKLSPDFGEAQIPKAWDKYTVRFGNGGQLMGTFIRASVADVVKKKCHFNTLKTYFIIFPHHFTISHLSDVL